MWFLSHYYFKYFLLFILHLLHPLFVCYTFVIVSKILDNSVSFCPALFSPLSLGSRSFYWHILNVTFLSCVGTLKSDSSFLCSIFVSSILLYVLEHPSPYLYYPFTLACCPLFPLELLTYHRYFKFLVW